MISNPILIERPIIIKGDKAIIARDLDKITIFYKVVFYFNNNL
jgi:arsenate reductase